MTNLWSFVVELNFLKILCFLKKNPWDRVTTVSFSMIRLFSYEIFFGFRKLPENNLLIHYEELHQNFEEEVQRLASFVGREALARHEIEKLKLLTSVEAMFDRLENERNFKGLGVINKGEIERWKKEFPDGYEEKFDEMTRKIFSEDEIITYYI